jgi:spore maturation protein CgeB
VGQWHPYREWLINRIRKAGFSVKVLGYRWPGGPVALEEMVQIFNQSKVNLNLSNSTSWDVWFLASSPKAIHTRLMSEKRC